MKGEQKTIPFEEFASNLETIFDQLKAHGEEITVEHGDTLYVLRPKTRRSRRRTRQMTRDDAMWDIVGIASSGEPGNTVASNKYPYVAEAIAAHVELHRRPEILPHDDENEEQRTPPASNGAS